MIEPITLTADTWPSRLPFDVSPPISMVSELLMGMMMWLPAPHARVSARKAIQLSPAMPKPAIATAVTAAAMAATRVSGIAASRASRKTFISPGNSRTSSRWPRVFSPIWNWSQR